MEYYAYLGGWITSTAQRFPLTSVPKPTRSNKLQNVVGGISSQRGPQIRKPTHFKSYHSTMTTLKLPKHEYDIIVVGGGIEAQS